MTEFESTPNSRRLSVPDFVKRNVDTADPNGGRCLVTNRISTPLHVKEGYGK
jgi:hypothetical protein